MFGQLEGIHPIETCSSSCYCNIFGDPS